MLVNLPTWVVLVLVVLGAIGGYRVAGWLANKIYGKQTSEREWDYD